MDGDLRAVRLRSFADALTRFESALAQTKTEWTRDAAIQRFEFSFELAWKAVAACARSEGLEARSPREALMRGQGVFGVRALQDYHAGIAADSVRGTHRALRGLVRWRGPRPPMVFSTRRR